MKLFKASKEVRNSLAKLRAEKNVSAWRLAQSIYNEGDTGFFNVVKKEMRVFKVENTLSGEIFNIPNKYRKYPIITSIGK